MDWLAIIRENGFLGAAVILLCWVIWYLISWVRDLIEARQRDAERAGERALERERETLSALNDLTNAIKDWGRNDRAR